MRKPLLLLMFFTGFVKIAAGQNLLYGFSTGLSFASQLIDDPAILGKTSVTTYNIGVFLQKPFKKSWYLDAGIGITGKGVTTFDNSQTSIYRLTYLDVPVDMLYKLNLQGLGKFFVGAGPYMSIGLGGNEQFLNPNSSTGQNLEFSKDGDYRLIDVGANIAAGFELNNHLTLRARYSLGLNNIASDNPDDGINSIKNHVFSIGFGFLY